MKSKNTKLPQVMLLGLIFLSFLGLTIPSHAQANESFLMRDGVVIDANRNQIIITTPQKKVEAIAIATGRTTWRSQTEAKALAILNNTLICQASSANSPERVVIKRLNLRRSGAVISSESIQLPKEVVATLTQTLNDSFDVKARVNNNQLFFSWDFQKRNLKGLREDNTNNQESSGIVKTSGAFRLGNRGRLSTIEKSQIPSNGSQSIIPSATQRIANVDGRQFISRDRKYILVSKKIASDEVFKKYSWEIYNARTQQKIGGITSYKSYAPFYVNNNILVFETGLYTRNIDNRITSTPLQISAVNLQTGTVLWSIEILDSIYRGPTPP